MKAFSKSVSSLSEYSLVRSKVVPYNLLLRDPAFSQLGENPLVACKIDVETVLFVAKLAALVFLIVALGNAYDVAEVCHLFRLFPFSQSAR